MFKASLDVRPGHSRALSLVFGIGPGLGPIPALVLAVTLALAVVFIIQVTLAVLNDLPLRPKTSGHAASTQNFGWL